MQNTPQTTILGTILKKGERSYFYLWIIGKLNLHITWGLLLHHEQVLLFEQRVHLGTVVKADFQRLWWHATGAKDPSQIWAN